MTRVTNKQGTLIDETVSAGATVTEDLNVQNLTGVVVAATTDSGADLDLEVYAYQPITDELLDETALDAEFSKDKPWVQLDVAGWTKVQVSVTNNSVSAATVTATYGGQ